MKVWRYLRTIDSPSAFTWQTWAIAYAPSVSTAVLHDRNLYGGTHFEWLLVAIVGALGAGAVLLLGHLVLRDRHPMVVLLAVFFLAGCVRGIGVGWSADLLGLVPDPQFGVRALSGGILGIFWLSVATLIVDGFRRHRATRVELGELEERGESERRAAVDDLARLNARAQVDVAEQIREVRDDLQREASAMTSAELASTAERLHDLSAHVVRPLSHQAALPETTPTSVPVMGKRRGYSTIFRDAVTVDPFRPGWTLALLLPSILMTAVRGYGIVLGALGALWIAGMAALVLTVADKTLRRHLRFIPLFIRVILVVVVWFIAAAASAMPVAIAPTRQLGPADAWDVFGVPLFAYVPVMCLGLAIAGAITQAWALDEDSRRSRIEALTWQAQRLHQQVWAERTRLGRFLHGSVQSALTSTALFIDSSVSRGDDPSTICRQAATRLGDLFTTTEAGVDPGAQVDVSDVLTRIAQVWSRVANISIDIDSPAQRACALDSTAAESVVEVVRDGITNAIRHGGAQALQVTINVDAEEIVVVVVDDGSFTASTNMGLGTSILDNTCASWSRERSVAGGTILTCRVATRNDSLVIAPRS